MKSFSHFLLLCALVLLSGAAGAATIIIKVGDNYYDPAKVTVHPGDVVKWDYQGGANSHPTASDTQAWSTFTINSANLTHSVTFPTAGTFAYHCTFHGGPGVGMFGVITVAAALAVHPAREAAAPRVYPNPATGFVTLKLDRAQVREHNAVQLFNPLGRLVRTLEVRREDADHELLISLADLPAGLYYYRLLVNNEVVAVQRLSLVR